MTLLTKLLIVYGIFWLIVIASKADAHQAPSGWYYPVTCCSNKDCREVSSKAVLERPAGYVIAETGEVIKYGDKRLRNSPDGVYHWCSSQGKVDGHTICLFIPPPAY